MTTSLSDSPRTAELVKFLGTSKVKFSFPYRRAKALMKLNSISDRKYKGVKLRRRSKPKRSKFAIIEIK